MRLHNNWYVTLKYLAELQGMTKAKLMKVIESKHFFGGLHIDYVNQQEKAIYDRIKSKEAKRLTKGIEFVENPKGNRKDNRKG